MPTRDKHYSLLRTFINYGCKKFDNIVHWGKCYKTFLSVILNKLEYLSLASISNFG
jgi:hypothetical protein